MCNGGVTYYIDLEPHRAGSDVAYAFTKEFDLASQLHPLQKLGAALAVGTAVPLAYLGLAGRKKAMARIGQTKSGLIEDALIVAAGAAVVAMATGRRR